MTIPLKTLPQLLAITILLLTCQEPPSTRTPNMASSSNMKPTRQMADSSDRAEAALREKRQYLVEELAKINVEWETALIYLRAFKAEKVLEVWARNDGETGFRKLLEYEFCATSGRLGPKRKQGDYQTPEGLYYIDRFNPRSKFHLSLGVDYPNQSDRQRGNQAAPGGDIFIHGNCVTIGCIPITDDKIKELYVLAAQVKQNGQDRIRVDMFPMKMTEDNMEILERLDPDLLPFWQEIQPFYEAFERNREVPRFSINGQGVYELKG